MTGSSTSVQRYDEILLHTSQHHTFNDESALGSDSSDKIGLACDRRCLFAAGLENLAH